MTKRVYEVAKELGVSASDIIKTLGEHNIKATNFSGVDDQAKHVLDKAYAPKKEHAAGHGARKRRPCRQGKITVRMPVKNEQRTEKNNKNGIPVRRIIRDTGRKLKRAMQKKKHSPAIILIASSRI